MNNTKKAPCAVSAEGRTNAINYTPNSADTNPAHPANLCPAVAEHLLLAAFGEAFGGLSARTVRAAQELALTIVIQAAGCTREPVLAWRVSSMASAGGKMLAAYARLSGDDAVVVGDGRECREIVISTYDASLGMGHGPTTPPDPLMTEEFGVGMCLLDFAHHARRYHYDAAGIVRLADEVDPSSPFGPWADVARELGVAHE